LNSLDIIILFVFNIKPNQELFSGQADQDMKVNGETTRETEEVI